MSQLACEVADNKADIPVARFILEAANGCYVNHDGRLDSFISNNSVWAIDELVSAITIYSRQYKLVLKPVILVYTPVWTRMPQEEVKRYRYVRRDGGMSPTPPPGLMREDSSPRWIVQHGVVQI